MIKTPIDINGPDTAYRINSVFIQHKSAHNELIQALDLFYYS